MSVAPSGCGRCRGGRAVAAVAGGEHVGLGDAPAGAAALRRRRGRRPARRRRGAATGETLDALGSAPRRSASGRGLGAVGGLRRGRAAWPRTVAAGCMRAMTWPTVTVSPAWARISAIVPDAGAGTSASTLSVEISTSVSSASTASPRLLGPLEDHALGDRLAHRGHDDVDGLALGGLLGRGPRAAPAAGRRPAPSRWWRSRPAPRRRARCRPRRRGSSRRCRSAGAGTSASTLSVEISTRISSSETVSPSSLRHSRTVPSETESPIAGMTTSTVVSTAIRSLRIPFRRHYAAAVLRPRILRSSR